jgi:hypothetical protein
VWSRIGYQRWFRVGALANTMSAAYSDRILEPQHDTALFYGYVVDGRDASGIHVWTRCREKVWIWGSERPLPPLWYHMYFSSIITTYRSSAAVPWPRI